MLDVEQDIIRQIGVCLNDEERRRAQGLGLEQDHRRFVAARGQRKTTRRTLQNTKQIATLGPSVLDGGPVRP